MLRFYTNPQSRGAIVRWMLEEVGQPYEAVVLPYGPAMKSADYLSVNPMGKVPAIVHEGPAGLRPELHGRRRVVRVHVLVHRHEELHRTMAVRAVAQDRRRHEVPAQRP